MTINPAIQFLEADSDVQLLNQTKIILRAMTGNPSYPSPAPELPAVADAADTFAATLADATDDFVAMKIAKHAARGLLVRLLRQLAGHVQVTCKGNRRIFLSSGFSVQAPATPLLNGLPKLNWSVTNGGHSREFNGLPSWCDSMARALCGATAV